MFNFGTAASTLTSSTFINNTAINSAGGAYLVPQICLIFVSCSTIDYLHVRPSMMVVISASQA